MLSFNRNQIGNNPFSGEKSGLTTTLEAVFDRPLGSFQFALNIGHRWRQIGTRIAANDLIGRVPNQAIYSLGLSYYKNDWDSNLIAEIFGSQPTQAGPDGSNFSDRSERALEGLIGIKHQWSHQLALHGGVGREIIKGFGTPDIRLYAGLNYAFGMASVSTSETTLSRDTVVEEKVYTLANMGFEFDSAILTQDSVALFAGLAETIGNMTEVAKIQIEGHTDSIGDAAYNLSLSQKRAESIKTLLDTYLKKRAGEVSDKLKSTIPTIAIGYGETRPLTTNTNFQGRSKNRRVVITVFFKGKN